MKSTRLLKFDVIRTIAIFMIVMIHVSAYVVLYYNKDTSSSAFIIANVFNGLSRAGTPMFLMLSGALLLDENKKTDTRTFYKKKLLSILLLLIIWLFFYASWRAIILPKIHRQPPDFSLFRDYLLKLPGLFSHLWYLFMLVGVYIFIPILRLFVKKENRYYVLGYIMISVFAQFTVKTADILTRRSSFTISDFFTKFHLEYASGYMPYVLIGWYLSTFPPKKKIRRLLLVAGGISVISIILLVQFLIDDIPNVREYIVSMDTLPAMLYGVALFMLICEICKDRISNNRLIINISVSAFGIYILHVMILDIMLLLMPCRKYCENYVALYIITLYLFVFGITYFLVFIFSKIKGVRKLFRF